MDKQLTNSQQRMLKCYVDSSNKEVLNEIEDIVNSFYDRKTDTGMSILNENLICKAGEIHILQELIFVLSHKLGTENN